MKLYIICTREEQPEKDNLEELIANHGHHFTTELAESESKAMVNADGSHHSWTTKEVKDTLLRMGITIEPSWHVTLGDLTFAANMAYADFYPNVIKTEADCIRYAVSLATDPDGYEGIIFSRWIADKMAKGDYPSFT